MARFIVVPQWQGSPSTRAMALIDGAEAIAGDLPRSATTRVDVPLEAGEALGTGVHRASSLQRVQQAIVDAVTADPDVAPIVIGGDASVSIPAVGVLQRPGDLAVAWFSAQGPTHSPQTSPDGALAGMALRAIVGGFDGALALSEHERVPADRIAMIDARGAEDDSQTFLANSGVLRVDSGDPARGDVSGRLAAAGARRLYIHIDLDVLDPAEVAGVSSPVPFGLTPARLLEEIATLRASFALAGAAISGFSPASPTAAVDDMGTILRIIGALSR